MKPEPLTKEIENVIVSDIEQIRDDIKSGYAFIESYDDVLDILKKTLPQKVSTIIKHKIKWLLKEIEKKRKEIENAVELSQKTKLSSLGWMYWFENKIKKAFSGVIEE